MTHFPRSRVEIQNGLLGENHGGGRYAPQLRRSRTDVRPAGTRSSPVKPNLGDEIFNIAHQWLIDKTGSAESDRKVHDVPTIEVNPPTPSRDIKVYIPLEKTYRAELRQITERIGLKLNENESSRAARDFVTQNPVGTEDIITQEKERTEKALAEAKKSTTLLRAQTAFGNSYCTMNRRRSCFEAGNRTLEYSHFAKQFSQSIDSPREKEKLFLKVKPQDQLSIESKSSKCKTKKISPVDLSENHRLKTSQNEMTLFSHRKLTSRKAIIDEKSGRIKIDNQSYTARTLVRRKAQRRTPNATKTIPPVALEESLRHLQNNSSFYASGTPDITSNYALLFKQERRQTMPNLEIHNSLEHQNSNSPRYLALPSYDLRYHLETERPWINDEISEDESETPNQNHSPPADCVSLSVRKVTEWLARCPSPSNWSQSSFRTKHQ